MKQTNSNPKRISNEGILVAIAAVSAFAAFLCLVCFDAIKPGAFFSLVACLLICLDPFAASKSPKSNQ